MSGKGLDAGAGGRVVEADEPVGAAGEEVLAGSGGEAESVDRCWGGRGCEADKRGAGEGGAGALFSGGHC